MHNRSSKKSYRSCREIKSAFIALLETNDYDSITIQMIADKSSYSKSTFYTHFLDKDDLAEKSFSTKLNSW